MCVEDVQAQRHVMKSWGGVEFLMVGTFGMPRYAEGGGK